ncbi:MAG: hypothetical protein WBR26_13525 [Candidatus Acidiferrum sp.]
MNKLTYYRQKIQQLKAEASAQKQTIADLQQRLFMIEAELFAFETAADLETPQEEVVPDHDVHGAAPLEKQQPPTTATRTFIIEDPANQEPPTYAATLRNMLGNSNCGMTPADILKGFAARNQEIKPEYLYALLSRLRSRGEIKRRAKKYSINENRSLGISR